MLLEFNMSRPSPAPLSFPLPVVLDTNVVLDLLVFDDPVSRPLAEALAQGSLIAWADAETLLELERVLTLPIFKLDEVRQRDVYARYLSQVRQVPASIQEPLPELPRCRDRDDQKFLLLTARAGAAWLVSKDKRVLSLADRHGLPFTIVSPRQAVERLMPL
ncbi:putative toxin-antitoxin system toxin component, PIN family [Hyalangium minutum]|uniref:PIN domain protein n=1 Tax=Hyalangium minutum TaxID=394096 RepID=A0A085WWV2_9BACT|nr:putative toxin-antitoxin system toxin component, PIN family [Hyalangium minutum]KFE72165.1 PIN domain protein [Hyalangium minutum]